jgi:hypothetical protein
MDYKKTNNQEMEQLIILNSKSLIDLFFFIDGVQKKRITAQIKI